MFCIACVYIYCKVFFFLIENIKVFDLSQKVIIFEFLRK